MDAKDLLWFSSGFRTVEAWRDAMCAHGYRVPVHLCHGLHEAMQYLDLTFPAAFRLLWVNRKIFVNGRLLVYDFSVSDLWAAGNSRRPIAAFLSSHHPACRLIPLFSSVWTLVSLRLAFASGQDDGRVRIILTFTCVGGKTDLPPANSGAGPMLVPCLLQTHHED